MFPGQFVDCFLGSLLIDLKLVPLEDWFLCFKNIDSKIVLQKEKDSGKTVFYPGKIDFNTLKGLFFYVSKRLTSKIVYKKDYFLCLRRFNQRIVFEKDYFLWFEKIDSKNSLRIRLFFVFRGGSLKK